MISSYIWHWVADQRASNMQVFYVMPLSGFPCYIIFWSAMLYLCLDCKFIPMSGLQCYTYVWFASLYLFLLYSIIPTSVMVTSAFSKFDFRPVISISGLQFYTYVCYIQFWFIQFYWLWHRPLYRLPRPRHFLSLKNAYLVFLLVVLLAVLLVHFFKGDPPG